MAARSEATQNDALVSIAGFDAIEFRSLDLDDDLSSIHDWFSRDYARFWGLQGKSAEEVKAIYNNFVSREGCEVLMGVLSSNGQRIGLVEIYRPITDVVGAHFDVRESDRGFHFLMAPSERRIHNLTFYLLYAAMEYIFRDSSIQRIVGEPDIRNEKFILRCAQLGFSLGRIIRLPSKTAQLVFLSRNGFSRINYISPPPRPRFPFRKMKVAYHLMSERIAMKLSAIRRRLQCAGQSKAGGRIALDRSEPVTRHDQEPS